MNKLDEYKYLPHNLKNHSLNHLLFTNKWTSGTEDIRNFLKPGIDQKFLDLGCFQNLYRYSIYEWPSRYYGVDISSQSILFLKQYVNRKRMKIGGLIIASIDHLPFKNNYFEIAACLNVFEYYPIDYIKYALKEIYRVLKDNAKIVLDILNIEHPTYKLALKIERYFNRPNLFESPRKDFEKLLKSKFSINNVDTSQIMVRYYLKKI
jgi:ubiquinone/menaquinone biosynthesis C-methylase UbiE